VGKEDAVIVLVSVLAYLLGAGSVVLLQLAAVAGFVNDLRENPFIQQFARLLDEIAAAAQQLP
jgi:hypothetical protein